jgi:hypothetical protein
MKNLKGCGYEKRRNSREFRKLRGEAIPRRPDATQEKTAPDFLSPAARFSFCLSGVFVIFVILLVLLFATGCTTTAPDYFTGWQGAGVNSEAEPDLFTLEAMRSGARAE